MQSKLDFTGLNVLVIGDVMVDFYLFGEVNRISPEAPVPVVEILTKEARPGGAANQRAPRISRTGAYHRQRVPCATG